MGSVIDYIECPNCGHEAFDDFYYRTGEEYTNCQNCGYHHHATIKNRDKTLIELEDSDWDIVTIENPYGAYRCQYKGLPGAICGTLAEEKDLDILIASVKSQEREVEYLLVSRLVENEIKKEYIINNTVNPE